MIMRYRRRFFLWSLSLLLLCGLGSGLASAADAPKPSAPAAAPAPAPPAATPAPPPPSAAPAPPAPAAGAEPAPAAAYEVWAIDQSGQRRREPHVYGVRSRCARRGAHLPGYRQ